MNTHSFSITTKSSSIKRKLVIRSLAILLPTLFLLVLLEGSARVYVHFAYGVQGKSYGLWRYDNVLGASHRESAYNSHTQTNNFGFRNQEDVIQPKPEGALRILTYGGSTTFCYNLSDIEAWPSRLQQYLRQSTNNHQHQVLNAGAIMWSISHAFERAKKDLPILKPDYVIIYSGINEHSNNYYLELSGTPVKSLMEKKLHGVFAKNMDQNRWVKRNLVMIRILEYRIKPWLFQFLPRSKSNAKFTIPESSDPYILKNYLHVLEQFIDLILVNGAKAIFIPQIHDQSSDWNRYLTSYSNNGSALAKDKGAQIVEANQIINAYSGNPGDLFYITGRHLSPRGAELFSELIYDEVFAKTK